MSNVNVIRAWKDPEYRANLPADELAALPVNPAGMMELGEFEQRGIEGGGITVLPTLLFTCLTDYHGTCNTAICDITKTDCLSSGSTRDYSTDSGGSSTLVVR